MSRREFELEERERKLNAQHVTKDRAQNEEALRLRTTNNLYLATEIALLLVVVIVRFI